MILGVTAYQTYMHLDLTWLNLMVLDVAACQIHMHLNSAHS